MVIAVQLHAALTVSLSALLLVVVVLQSLAARVHAVRGRRRAGDQRPQPARRPAGTGRPPPWDPYPS